MDISGEYEIPASRERVWEALNDPDTLQRCIPGCESLEQISDTEMKARVMASIGPVKARFNTTLKLESLLPPESYTLTGEAKAGAAGFGRGKADVRLSEGAAGTQLTYDADFKVGGKLAQVGSRLVAGATRKTADEFFGNLARELGAEDAAPEAAVAGRRSNGPLYAGLAVGVLLILWILLG